MKKLKVYLDTSVIGGCFDDEFSEHSKMLIKEIKEGYRIGFISTITVREIELAPDVVKEFFGSISKFLEILEENQDAFSLANLYIENGIISRRYFNDGLHIAYATINDIDVLVSWNFKHIVNYEKILLFNAVNRDQGYRHLDIYSPREVIADEEKI